MSPTAARLPKGRARPLDVQRDLPAVADLIVLAFGHRLDAEGHHLVRHMRQAARNGAFLRWAARQGEVPGMPLSGYVWEEEGRIVGHVSLIPMGHRRRQVYLIANVAVHPARRRQGIARRLMEQALDHARRRRVGEVWLQVDADNHGAQELYRQLAFHTRARRCLWRWVGLPEAPKAPGLSLSRLGWGDAPRHRAWLLRAYPPEIGWFYPLSLPADLAPTPLGGLRRLLGKRWVQQVAVRRGGALALALARLRTRSAYDALFLAAPPAWTPQALALAAYALNRRASRPVLLDYPASQHPNQVAAFEAAGFVLHRDLLWMRWEGPKA